MLAYAHRFHGHNSLKMVYKYGQTTHGPLFALKTRPNPRRRTYRVAVVVGRKVNKSAVARNRIRRRLYGAIKELDHQITEPYDIVINVFHDSAKTEDYTTLRGQLKKQLKDAGVIKKRPTS